MGFRQGLAALTARARTRARARSTSLHGRSDPAIAALNDSANAILGWTKAPAQAWCTVWIGEGVDHLRRLLEGLVDQLHQPQIAASPWTGQLLQDLIVLADAHVCFCEVLQSLKSLLIEAQAAVRHCDAVRLAAALHARRSFDRTLSSLASNLRGFSLRASSPTAATPGSGEAALARAVEYATCAAAAASAAIFAGLTISSSSSALKALTSTMAASPAKAMERLRGLEECVVAADDGCQKVHRALVNARASLLNLLSAE